MKGFGSRDKTQRKDDRNPSKGQRVLSPGNVPPELCRRLKDRKSFSVKSTAGQEFVVDRRHAPSCDAEGAAAR